MCEECAKLREELTNQKAIRNFYEGNAKALNMIVENQQKTIDGLIGILKGEPEP